MSALDRFVDSLDRSPSLYAKAAFPIEAVVERIRNALPGVRVIPDTTGAAVLVIAGKVRRAFSARPDTEFSMQLLLHIIREAFHDKEP